MGAARRATVVLGTLTIVAMLSVGGCVYAIGRFERAFGGPCGRDAPTSPRPAMKKSELDELEQRNLALLGDFVASFGPTRSVERRLQYKCPTNFDPGDVVGLTTLATFSTPEGSTRCEVVRTMETFLASAGWATHSFDTPLPEGSGFAGQTDAVRDTAMLRASVDVASRSISVTVDSDDGVAGTSEWVAFPATPCR